MAGMDIWGAVAQTGSDVTNGMINESLNNIQSRRNYKYNIKLMEEASQHAMKETSYNMERAKELWEATGYGAQKDQMKRAELNPALMYGMGGGGGQTANVPTGSAPTASGGIAAAHVNNSLDIAQMKMLDAQIANLNADTAQKNATAAKLSGVDTEEAKTRISGNNIQNAFNEKTLEDRINKVNIEKDIALNQLSQEQVKTNVTESTRSEQIAKIKAEALLTAGQVLLTGANIKNTDKDTELKANQILKNNAEIQKMATDITQKWISLNQEQKKIEIDAFRAKLEAAYKGMHLPLGMQVPLHNTGQWIQEVDKIMKGTNEH